MAIELNQIWDFPIKDFHPFPNAKLGVGAHDMLGVEAKNLDMSRVLLMTTGLRGSGIIEELVGKIEYQGVDVVLYDKVESNPKDYNCMDAAALYQSEKCDGIISVGGGSSHDAAKGARMVIAHDGRNINEFEGFSKATNKENPKHIAVSTTAGTGRRLVGLCHHRHLRHEQAAQVGGLRRHLSGRSGHGRSAALLQLPRAFHRVLRFRRAGTRLRTVRLAAGLRAITGQRQVLHRAHPRSPAHRRLRAPQSGSTDRHDARAIHCGTGVQLRRSRLIHSLSHAVSAFYDSHHGLNNAIALPRVWEYNLPSRYERYADIAALLGVDTTNMTTVQAADAAVEEAIRLSKDLGIPDNFGNSASAATRRTG